MFENTLVIIPCREGSQRFTHKNTALINGIPLVVNTINKAILADLTKIIVTTDDQEVMDVVSDQGVKYINRPANLCSSDAKSEDVVWHAVEHAEDMFDMEFNSICLMQVTSPLLQASSLKTALNVYEEHHLPSLTAVNCFYQPVGAFYIVNRELFEHTKSLYQPGGGVYVLSPKECLDVDYPYQLDIANMVSAGQMWGGV